MNNKFIRIWKESSEILQVDKHSSIKQVYTWLTTSEQRLVLVSKNGESWQLPGGKPNLNESLTETAVRETQEETGLDISNYSSLLEFFGYYLIYEFDIETNKIVNEFLQVRFKLYLPLTSDKLKLEIKNEDLNQSTEDMIKHVSTFSFAEAFKKIPWLEGSEEYESYRKK